MRVPALIAAVSLSFALSACESDLGLEGGELPEVDDEESPGDPSLGDPDLVFSKADAIDGWRGALRHTVSGKCLTAVTATGTSAVNFRACSSNANQQWSWNSTQWRLTDSAGRCLSYASATLGRVLELSACARTNATQSFLYSPSDSSRMVVNADLCAGTASEGITDDPAAVLVRCSTLGGRMQFEPWTNIRVLAIRLSNDDGSEGPLSFSAAEQLTNARLHWWMTEAAALFRSAHVRLTFDPATDIIDRRDSFLNHVDDKAPPGVAQRAAMIASGYPDRIVVFFRHSPRWGGANYSSWLGNHAVVSAAYNTANGKNLQHELGHYLGLDHVFAGLYDDTWAASRALGMRDVSFFDGDQLADTAPSFGARPFAMANSGGNACGTPGTLTVLKLPGPGAVDVTPDKSNAMDYFACGTQRITPRQQGRIRLRLHNLMRQPLFTAITRTNPQPIFSWRGMCLEQRTVSGAPRLGIFNCEGATTTRWTWTAARQIQTGPQCIQAVNFGDTGSFALAPCSNVPAQRFTRTPSGDIKVDLDGQCMATAQDTPPDATQLVRRACSDENRFKWWTWFAVPNTTVVSPN